MLIVFVRGKGGGPHLDEDRSGNCLGPLDPINTYDCSNHNMH